MTNGAKKGESKERDPTPAYDSREEGGEEKEKGERRQSATAWTYLHSLCPESLQGGLWRRKRFGRRSCC